MATVRTKEDNANVAKSLLEPH